MNHQPNQIRRLIYLILYIFLLFVVNKMLFGQWLPLTNEKGLWFYTGLVALLIGNLIVSPYFTSPANAISYAVAALVATFSFKPKEYHELFYLVLGLCSLIIISCFLNILFKNSKKQTLLNISDSCRIIADSIGAPRVLYTVILFYVLYVFHKNSSDEILWIAGVGLFIILKVIEHIDWSISKIYNTWIRKQNVNVVGEIVAYQIPNIILLRLLKEKYVSKNDCLLISDPNFGNKLGIALGYTGRDEGVLLRVLEFSIPSNDSNRDVRNTIEGLSKQIPENSAAILDKEIIDKLKSDIEILKKTDCFVGIVDVDTTIENLFVEIINEEELEEGKLLETNIKGKSVMYQLMDGLTKEDIVAQKNKYGYAKAEVKKIGIWNDISKKFENVKWLPSINTPVYIKKVEDVNVPAEAIGRFPSTNYYVSIKNFDHLVTHNTAILGILGIGKSMLSIELVERMISQKIKVVCMDLTNQYSLELKDFLNIEKEKENLKNIIEAGEKDRESWTDSPQKGGSIENLRKAIIFDLKEFIEDEKRYLKIYNPMQINGSKQIYDPKSYAIGKDWFRFASLWSLTPVEVTQIISECTLLLLQGEMTDKARVCLVFEEAHSLIPEWGSVVNEGDRQATSGTARAILQGRKYGLGCFVVTQRTANVTKTILNQCNTLFAMRTFDDTGKDFISNYIGKSYTDKLSALDERCAVVFGKASSCENPVRIRLNDREDFVRQFRTEHPVPKISTDTSITTDDNDQTISDNDLPF